MGPCVALCASLVLASNPYAYLIEMSSSSLKARRCVQNRARQGFCGA